MRTMVTRHLTAAIVFVKLVAISKYSAPTMIGSSLKFCTYYTCTTSSESMVY